MKRNLIFFIAMSTFLSINTIEKQKIETNQSIIKRAIKTKEFCVCCSALITYGLYKCGIFKNLKANYYYYVLKNKPLIILNGT